MKILIVNQPLNNRGDEAAHKALVRNIHKQFPESKITVMFLKGSKEQKDIDAFNVHETNVKYLRISPYVGWGRAYMLGLCHNLWLFADIHPTVRRLKKEIKRNDIIVCAPGGICMGGFQNWVHIFILYIAKRLKKDIFYYGRSFGPFPIKTPLNKRFKEISYELLHYFKYLSIRDKKTQLLADEIGIPYISTTDTAFLESPNSNIPELVKHIIGNSLYVVIVPNVLIWHYAYKAIPKDKVTYFFCQIIEYVLHTYPQYKVVMLPQTFNSPVPLRNDINFFYDLQKQLKNDRIIVIPDTFSSDVQQSIIKNAQFLIGARYHSVVFALNNNVPFVALSYEHKIAGLLELLHKEDCMVDITNIFSSEDKMKDALSKVKTLLTVIKKDDEAHKMAKEMAKKAFNEFVKTVIQSTSKI